MNLLAAFNWTDLFFATLTAVFGRYRPRGQGFFHSMAIDQNWIYPPL